MIHHTDDWLTVYGGDARDVLPTLDAGSVHCVVTSPPYWGLRDYGTATWIGGSEECDHKVGRFEYETPVSDKQRSNNGSAGHQARDECPRCGAQRQDSQLGLEATPEEYVANLVAVFREVRRVLRDDGTLWLNLGDSYAGYWGDKKAREEGRRSAADTNGWTNGFHMNARPQFDNLRQAGLKPKDLVGIPWRVAFALQADGWWLRSDIIWAKPNPMPESVTDRPTKAHEYLFLLTKRERYYFDQEAVREAVSMTPGAIGRIKNFDISKQIKRAELQDLSTSGLGTRDENGRNLRSVWTIATRPYPGAHFAVFPPELPERCIKAGCPENGVVLDPFAGSGTVGLVANRLSRRAILIDLNPEYLEQQMKRNAQVPLGV